MASVAKSVTVLHLSRHMLGDLSLLELLNNELLCSLTSDEFTDTALEGMPMPAAMAEWKNQTPNNEMNGHADVSQACILNKNEPEMLQQIKQLFIENNKLKETMKHQSQEMKERLEDLLKRERQREQQGLAEPGLMDVKERVFELSKENEQLRKEIQHLKGKNDPETQNEAEVLKPLKAQILRLQAEKADLLGIISELQVKLSSCASEDSFVEIRMAEQDTEPDVKAGKTEDGTSRTKFPEEACAMESEELAVSKLLQSLREETEKVDRLQKELLTANEKLSELDQKRSDYIHKETETDPVAEQKDKGQQTAELLSVEVEVLKQKVEVLNKELHETNENLSGAQEIKAKLQDRCSSLEKKLADNQVDVDERQKLLINMNTMELHVESLKSQIKMEQSKTEDQIKKLSTLQEEFDKQKTDYELLRKSETEKVPKVQLTQLLQKLDACEQALAKKQLEIDEMKVVAAKHEEDVETIALLKAQIDVYCSDFHAEREARQNIHQEKEELATQLAYILQENERLKDERQGRQSIEQLQRRHGSLSGLEGNQGPHLMPRGAENLEPPGANSHVCPKCQLTVPDMDTLQIHVMDCIT
ncbi:optineurin [Gastrophryne carolinensis]